jgi:PAS domain S-box-containing protein
MNTRGQKFSEEEKYRSLFENVREGIYQSTPDGRIITANPALVTMLGYDSVDELKRLNIATDIYVNPEERDQRLQELLESNIDGDIELCLKRKDGTHIFVLEHSHPVLDEEGHIICFEGALTDITRRKNAETALRESEAKYQSLLETMQDGISVFDQTGRLLYFNQRKRIMLGYDSDQELYEKTAFDLIYPEDRIIARRCWEELIEKGVISNAEMRVSRKDGSHFWAEFNTTAIKNSDGVAEFFMDTMRDVTERKRDADLLRESAESYKALFNSITSAMYILNREGKFVNVNEGALDMYGYDRDFFVGKTPEFLSAPGKNDLEEVMRMIDEAFMGRPQRFEFWGLRKNGEVFPKEVSLFKTTYFADEAVIAIGVDITERKRVAEELRLHSEHLQKIIDLVPSYIFAKDIDGRFLLTNKALADVFGLKPSKIRGMTDADYGATPEQIEMYRAADLKVIEKGKPVMIPEEQVLRKDGSLGWFQTVKIPYIHPGLDKPAILGVATEITQRKEAEDELRRSEERFRKLFESHSAVKLLIDPADGSVVDANKAATEFYGWSTDTLRKMTVFEINTMPENGLFEMMKNATEQRSLRFEANHRLADGSVREVEVFTSKVEIDGKELLHSIIHDITEKRKILLDLIAAKEKAEESDRLKTAFLHNISHEIRTPLNAIVGFTALLDSSNLPEDIRRHYIDMVSQSSTQLLSVISDIVDISNIETGLARLSVTDTNINKILVNAFDLYSVQAGQKKLRFTFSGNLPDHKAVVLTDSTKLLQVLSNLISNAVKFTLSGSVSFGYSLKDTEIEFFVSDTGVGIPDDKRVLIYDRFYQIEDPNMLKTTGTGLGLSISKAYVELLGGSIWLDSTPGKGSTFYFTIPYSQGSGISSSSGVSEKEVKEEIIPGKTILIAEDDNVNFILMREMLSGIGATLVRAVNGEEAVNYCSKNRPVDLILMDIKMPVMDGYRAAELIKQSRPEIPIVAVTAYAHESDKEKTKVAGFAGYISKPVDRPKLISLISKFI